MGFEIDFLAVGDSSKSGDCIALRYGNLSGPRSEQTVVTIDGGTLESGDQLVDHILTHYGTNKVDFAFLTHPDLDHASGMRRILERIQVERVVMHLPWDHSHVIKQLVDDERTTVASLARRTKENLKAAKEIETLAKQHKIAIVEPFAGTATTDGVITVLGPTEQFYQQRLANFDFMPGAVSYRTSPYVESTSGIEVESWTTETLRDPPESASSARNNSSMILLINVDNHKLLLTGDAGVPAIEAAINYADGVGLSLHDLNFFQIPHHGSRKNLGPTVINRLFGRGRTPGLPNLVAVASVAKEGAPKHPNKKITNALIRRGATVVVTAGTHILYAKPWPNRAGYGPVDPVPLHTIVESDEVTE